MKNRNARKTNRFENEIHGICRETKLSVALNFKMRVRICRACCTRAAFTGRHTKPEGWFLFSVRIRIPQGALTGEQKAAILPSMIGLLRGRLLEKRPNQVIVDVGGVGYLVAIPLSTFAALGELHTEITLLIHTHVREDALALYGFLSQREKHLFELLLGASGVGPSLALKILSGMNVEELVPAIRTGDLGRLTKIPGVGRKTAERMVVELKDKLEAVAIEAEKPAPASPAGVEADVRSALINLGYDERAAESAVKEAKRQAGISNFEKLLREALSGLSATSNRQ
jgi:holliday junction DNA helicase RuvA